MLQTVRKYTQGWVATVMGIILSFAFVLWGVENYLSGNSKNAVAAKVNGKSITAAQVNTDFQRLMVHLKEQAGSNFSLPQMMQQQLKMQSLNNLIMQSVLLQAASNAGFRVTQAETGAMIRQMPAFQDQGHFSKERFNLIINKMGYTKEEFINDASESLLLNQVASGIIGSAFVLPNELNQAVALLEQKRDIEFVIIPSADFKKNAAVSEMEINDYYLRHKNAFKKPAEVQIEYLQLSSEDLKKNIKVTTQDVNEFFDANSELDRKNAKAIQKAKDAITQQKLEQAFLATSDKLTDLTYTNPHSLNDAARALGLTVKSSEYFSQEGGKTLLTKNPKVVATAFNADILKEHTNSGLIEVTPGTMVVIRVKDFKPESFSPINEVHEKIKQSLAEHSASDKAKQKGVAILTAIKTKADFRTVAAQKHLNVIAKQQISRHEKNVNPEVLKLAFSISPTATRPVYGAVLSNGDFALVNLHRSTDLPLEKMTKEQRSAMVKLYSDTYGKLDYHLYTEHQIDNSKIKTYSK